VQNRSDTVLVIPHLIVLHLHLKLVFPKINMNGGIHASNLKSEFPLLPLTRKREAIRAK
jgi:hypothetical protein